MTERISTRSGYRVITAATGAEAIALAAQHDGVIHLITDGVMPNMLGREVAETIQQARPIPRSSSCPGTPSRSSPPSADGPEVNLIDKPFSAAAIIEKARRLLNDSWALDDGEQHCGVFERLQRD